MHIGVGLRVVRVHLVLLASSSNTQWALIARGSHTQSRFQITRRTSPCFEKFLKILVALVLQRDTSILCSPVEACESLNTLDRAVHLTAETYQLFVELMVSR